jgi:transposase InsO family protein
MAINLPVFPEFDLVPRETAPVRYNKYVRRLENLFAAMNIDVPARRKAMLLHYAGEQASDVFETLTVPAVDNTVEALNDVYKCAVHAFKDYFEPQKCLDHLVYAFRKETQQHDETVNEFHTRLVILAKRCEFTDTDLEIKRQIIQGTHSNRLRRRAIEKTLTLEELLRAARAMEMADESTKDMEKQQSNAINTSRWKGKSKFKAKPAHTKPNTTCGLCGGMYPHVGDCPAKGKECRKCGRHNHFQKVCRGGAPKPANRRDQNRDQPQFGRSYQQQSRNRGYQRARVVDTDQHQDQDLDQNSMSLTHNTDDDEYTYHVSTASTISEKPFFNVTINGSRTRVMADSGATVNIMNTKDYRNLIPSPRLASTTTRIFPYMSETPLELRGRFEAELRNDGVSCRETFYVAEGPSTSLLSWKTSQMLNLIRTANAVTEKTRAVTEKTWVPDYLAEFPNVTKGMGACKVDPVKIHVDPNISPVAQPHRRIPFHVRKQVEEKLLELEQSDIIERSEGPTPWISPIVVVPKPRKPDEIRICVDMRSVNRAIIRERHVIPTIDDIAADLNGCTVFSKLDLKQGYHQILLHPDSRNLTTFSTHAGLWRYKRLNFGMTSSAEIFQKIVSDVIKGIPGVRNISDDIYVGGKDTKEHDERLKLVLIRLSEYNLTINLPKCEFRVSSMLFFGHQFSASGISPDPKKVADLKAISPPTNVTEVRSLLSSASFCSRFIKDFAIITRPLRRLTCKDVPWTWGEDEQSALDKLRSALSEKTTLSYFDPESPTIVFVDGSPVGLGAVLTQKTANSEIHPLHYASHPLSDTESRYPQIDREALSIYWSIKRFHLYLYGKEFKVITDHQPLVSLFNNPVSKPSARIERWIMDLQHYKFTVEYRPGANNPADYASRHPIGSSVSNIDEGQNVDTYIAYIAHNAVPKAMTLSEIEHATAQDPLLQATMEAMRTGHWYKPPPGVSIAELSRFERIKTELTCTDTLLLKSNRIVVPANLQERSVDIAHEGHLGIVKTKGLLREKVWFPLMDKLVDRKVRSCLPCQIATPVITREPLEMSPLPKGPFEKTSVDFAYAEGENVLLLIDEYSRFPFIEPIRSTAAHCVIPKLDRIFSTFGSPETLKSDNGPPFDGHEFARFAETLGFKHRKITPLWPRANGEVERLVGSFKKHVKVSKARGTNWKKDLESFLRDYRTSPHETTGVAPATLFLKRAVKNKLPQTPQNDPIAEIVRKRDSQQKLRMKSYADGKRYVKPSDLEVGDPVLVKRPFNMVKGNTPYETEPLTITAKKGSMITAKGEGRCVTRNTSFFKKLVINPELSDPSEPDADNADITLPYQGNVPAVPIAPRGELRQNLECSDQSDSSHVHPTSTPMGNLDYSQNRSPRSVKDCSGKASPKPVVQSKSPMVSVGKPELRRSTRVRKPVVKLDI